MFDIQHDSPIPIHEQLTAEIRSHVASDGLKAGAVLPEYRALAQELLTNPQVVYRAYVDLTDEGVLEHGASGTMVVTARGGLLCRTRLQELARARIRSSVALGAAWGLGDAEILKAVEQALAASKLTPLSPDEVLHAMKKPTHERSHRASQGIQDLSRQGRAGLP